MSDADLPQILARIAPQRRITAEDALAVRRALFSDMSVSAIEAETLIALDEAAIERCAEWNELFVEALTDFVVRQQHPPGYVDEDGADWLMKLIERDGEVRTASELDLLVHVLETADSAPQRLTDFALKQVKNAVLNGEGPLARSGRLEKGRIGAAEVDLLKRILYSAGGDGNVAITRNEAETLFDLNDAVRGQPNDPSWNDLFARAIGAAVMTVSTYQAPSRDEAARDEAWLNAPESMATFVGRMFTGSRRGALDGVFGPSAEIREWEAQNAREDAAIAAAEPISADEAAWLSERIGRDGQFDPAERALIAFLREESPEIDEALAPLVEQQHADDPEGAPPVFGRRRSIA
jgi:hypothetical protein